MAVVLSRLVAQAVQVWTNDGSAGSSLTGGLGGDGRTSSTTDGSGASGGLASGW